MLIIRLVAVDVNSLSLFPDSIICSDLVHQLHYGYPASPLFHKEYPMAECECLPKCPFFNDRMASKPATAQLMKNQYCLGDSSGCARHQVKMAAGSDLVPADLFPAQVDRVQGILGAIKANGV